MSQLNIIGGETKIPLLPRNNNQKLYFLKIYFSIIYVFIKEGISIIKISYPLAFESLLLYVRSLVTLSFLGDLGDNTLASGSLAAAFAYITGYFFFSVLTIGVESICSQAFRARRYNNVRATTWRGIILLLITSLPVSLVWIYMKKILVTLTRNEELASKAHMFLLYSLPDLITQSFLHPLRVYLRVQSKTLPLLNCTAIATFLYYPITLFFMKYLDLGIKGIALSGVLSSFNLVTFILLYICFFEEKLSVDEDEEIYEETYEDSTREWKKLIFVAIPSFISVWHEWWCYEIMILLCGLLSNPKATIASMSILIQITSLVYIFRHSLSLGVSSRVGYELVSNQSHRAKRTAIVGLVLSIALGFTALTFIVSVRNIWATCFTDNKYIIHFTAMTLPIIGLCELGNCLQTTGFGILKMSARPNIGGTVNRMVFNTIGIPVGTSMAFWFGFGVKGFWLGMLSAQIICVIVMMAATCRIDWELEAEMVRELMMAVDGSNNDDEEEDVEAGMLDN